MAHRGIWKTHRRAVADEITDFTPYLGMRSDFVDARDWVTRVESGRDDHGHELGSDAAHPAGRAVRVVTETAFSLSFAYRF